MLVIYLFAKFQSTVLLLISSNKLTYQRVSESALKLLFHSSFLFESFCIALVYIYFHLSCLEYKTIMNQTLCFPENPGVMVVYWLILPPSSG